MDIPDISQPSSSSSSTPARPRKRKPQPELWKRAVAKTKCARGASYTSPVSGEAVEARTQGPPCECKKKCFDKFTGEQLSRIFSCFWELGEKNVQDAYLHGLIRVRKVARARPRNEGSARTPRTSSFVYVVSARSIL